MQSIERKIIMESGGYTFHSADLLVGPRYHKSLNIRTILSEQDMANMPKCEIRKVIFHKMMSCSSCVFDVQSNRIALDGNACRVFSSSVFGLKSKLVKTKCGFPKFGSGSLGLNDHLPKTDGRPQWLDP